MTDDQQPYPVCDGCGERHPQMSPDQIFQVLLGAVAIEATKLTRERPGEFEALEAAVKDVNEFADVLVGALAEQGVIPKPPANRPAGGDAGAPGFYL